MGIFCRIGFKERDLNEWYLFRECKSRFAFVWIKSLVEWLQLRSPLNAVGSIEKINPVYLCTDQTIHPFFEIKDVIEGVGRNTIKYEKRLGQSPSLSLFGLSSKTQWLSGLYYADFISFLQPTQLCGGGGRRNRIPQRITDFCPLSFGG